MRTLLVSHSDVAGGAGRAAYRLHQAFRKFRFDSSMMVRQKLSDDSTVVCDDSVIAKISARIRSQIEHRFQRTGGSEKAGFVSLNFLPTLWSRAINRAEADIVNLHWFGSGALSIRDAARINRPVVMTLHDMWGFCGTEHYQPDGENAKWRVGARHGDLSGWTHGISRRVWHDKCRHWSAVPVVCPSEWLAECARSSVVMKDWRVHVIPNVLDVELFQPLDKEHSRKVLDLPRDHRLILFGAAAGAADKRKGFDLLIASLNQIDAARRETTGVIFGHGRPEYLPQTNVPLRWMGAIDDDHVLAQLYSAADVMVVPSRQEAFGQTASEAQACGTPVVAFDATGLVDVVCHRQTGYLATPFEPADLARGINWVLEDEQRRSALGSAARQRSIELWSPSVVVGQYRSVFEMAIEERVRACRRKNSSNDRLGEGLFL